MIAVQSSNLAGIDYDAETRTLVIAFHSGAVYEYYCVPDSEYAGLINAGSHGEYFQAKIKGWYRYRRIA